MSDHDDWFDLHGVIRQDFYSGAKGGGKSMTFASNPSGKDYFSHYFDPEKITFTPQKDWGFANYHAVPVKLQEDQMTAYRYIIYRKKTGTIIVEGTVIALNEQAARMKVAQEFTEVNFSSPKIVFIIRDF